ncbi:MAG: hypothetical protein K4571_11465 [Deltaproteobacteria bacterium]
MIIIFTKIIPARRLAAINLFDILLAPRGALLSSRTVNHEAIHTAQMKEMLYVFFYLWYLLEWLIRLLGKENAYRSIAFEKEAYCHDEDRNYLKNRKPYRWLKYL